jgi:hypothetical protein
MGGGLTLLCAKIGEFQANWGDFARTGNSEELTPMRTELR